MLRLSHGCWKVSSAHGSNTDDMNYGSFLFRSMAKRSTTGCHQTLDIICHVWVRVPLRPYHYLFFVVRWYKDQCPRNGVWVRGWWLASSLSSPIPLEKCNRKSLENICPQFLFNLSSSSLFPSHFDLQSRRFWRVLQARQTVWVSEIEGNIPGG